MFIRESWQPNLQFIFYLEWVKRLMSYQFARHFTSDFNLKYSFRLKLVSARWHSVITISTHGIKVQHKSTNHSLDSPNEP